MICFGPVCVYSYQDVVLGAVLVFLLVLVICGWVWFERNI